MKHFNLPHGGKIGMLSIIRDYDKLSFLNSKRNAGISDLHKITLYGVKIFK